MRQDWADKLTFILWPRTVRRSVPPPTTSPRACSRQSVRPCVTSRHSALAARPSARSSARGCDSEAQGSSFLSPYSAADSLVLLGLAATPPPPAAPSERAIDGASDVAGGRRLGRVGAVASISALEPGASCAGRRFACLARAGRRRPSRASCAGRPPPIRRRAQCAQQVGARRPRCGHRLGAGPLRPRANHTAWFYTIFQL